MKNLEKKTLMKKERESIETAAIRLKKQFPIQQVILFGSKARGDSDEHSDIDILLVTSRNLHWKEERAIVDRLFEIGMEFDVIFSPLLASDEEWNGGLFTEFPIPTTKLIILSFRRKPESSRSELQDGYFGSMLIGGILDAGSSPA